jgi:hypothetical protein
MDETFTACCYRISYLIDKDSKTARNAVVFKSLTMTAEGEPPSEETPYSWDDSALPPTEVFQLWTEVGNGIDKSQTGAFLDAGHFVILCREAPLRGI